MFRMAALGALVCGLALLSSPASAAEKEDVELLQVFQAEEAAISAKRGKWAQTLEVTQCNRIAGYAKCDFMHEDYPIQIFFMRHHNGWVSGTGEGEYRILWVLRVAAVAALVLGVFLLSLFVLTTGGRRFKAAGYVMLFTTLPAAQLSAADVLELYRYRWQVELAFKRLKQLLRIGQLPHKDRAAATGWIQAKLVVALLLETLFRSARIFSPWGYELQPGKAR